MNIEVINDKKYDNILTGGAKLFLADLAQTFSSRIDTLVSEREERQQSYDSGNYPKFLEETRDVRESEWKIADVPSCLYDRRVEITGPPERKMVINALNSGAKVYMSDFEDSLSPTWENVMTGQANLRDAVRGNLTYQHPAKGLYIIRGNPAVLFVRPRGLHLKESNVVFDGSPIYASLFDFGLFVYHNAIHLHEKGMGPFFYIPKLEHYMEARLWNDIFLHTEEYFHITHGTIKATVLIETLPAAFQMNEILYELKDHSAGLNCGRWDYIFSYIKTLRGHSDKILPDREEINMNVHFMKSYSELLIQTCHRRGAHAMGGMAAQIPIRNDKKANDIAIEKVRNDKLTEVKRGHDGTWVAHPGLVSLAMEVFNEYMPMNNQIGYVPKSTNVDQLDLLKHPGGPITEAGVRKNIEVGIQYLANWISGNGCVPINNLMEDAATAEISRTQLWQWVTYGVTLDSEKKVTNEFVSSLIDEYVNKVIVNSSNDKLNFSYNRAGVIFKDMTMNDSLENFLTIPAYKELSLGA